jgi:chromate transporter
MAPTFGQIVRAFVALGLTSFGGGRTSYIYEALVARRRWVRTEDFLQDLMLSQILPGPNFSNLAVAVGHRLAGLRGAVAAFAAVLTPGALVLLVYASLYFHGDVTPGARTLMRGAGAAVAAFVVVSTARLASAFRGWRAWLVVAVTFAAVGPLRLSTVATILVVGALSLWLHRPRA